MRFDREHWRELMRRAWAGRSEGEVADLTDLSQPWLNQIKNGRKPSRGALVQIADGLQVDAELRAEMFRAAGFTDPAADFASVYNGGGYFLLGLRRLAALYGEERVGEVRFSQFPPPETPVEQVDAALHKLEASIQAEGA